MHHDTQEFLAWVLDFLGAVLVRAVEGQQLLDHVPRDALHTDEGAYHTEHDRGIQRNIAALGDHHLQTFGVQCAQVALAWLGFEEEVKRQDKCMLDVIRRLDAIEILGEESLLRPPLARHVMRNLQPLFHGVSLIHTASKLLSGELVGVFVGFVAPLLIPRILQQALKCHEVDESGRVHQLILMNEGCLCRNCLLNLVRVLHC